MIPIKTPREIKIMREGGKILSEITFKVKEKVSPGKKTEELNRLAESLLFRYGKPSFKGYKSSGGRNGKCFPAAICTSLNEEIVHGIPSERVLLEGDILSLDLGLLYKGFHTDMAITVAVGKVDTEKSRLITTAKKALKRGINEVKPGNFFGNIGNAVEKYVESQGFTVIKNFCGHGIGRDLHEDPQIINYGEKKTGSEMKEGMTFCLEPIIGNGSWEVEKADNGIAYKTKDGSLSVHFEHTVAVTKKGVEVLTKN